MGRRNKKQSCVDYSTESCIRRSLGEKECKNGFGIIYSQTKGNSKPARIRCIDYKIRRDC